MPALEMAQETGKVVAWRKKEGEPVTKGEPLLEIETDKAVVEIEAAGDGILSGITAQAGDVVPVGHTIAWLLARGEAVPAAVAPVQTGRRTDTDRTAAPAAAPSSSQGPAAGERSAARISPKARRLAQERGVDLSALRGSGPGGEILADDILAAAAGGGTSGSPATLAGGSVTKVSTIGRLMAERTLASWNSAPHFFVTRTIDATALGAWRDRLVPQLERSHSVKPTHTDLLVSLVGRVLRQHPRLNASWTPDGIRVHPDVHVGLAIAVDEGVVTVVIRNADTASIADIAVQRRELATRARAGKLQPADLSGATFTISNLGMFQVDSFTAIIVPPQAAILAVGAIVDHVVPVDGPERIGVRPMLTVTLSCDHRVLDGARGAAFLSDLASALRNPE
jgi:pyruvate dehydrogenase E2 component (dihydrolipoamide acetyltransferase)